MKFIICAPGYTAASAGISALYDLNNGLNQLGHSSEIMMFNEIRSYDPQAIVVYPEIISDNPLQAQRVVRYMLFFDAYITGIPISPGPSDFILAWERVFYPQAHDTLAISSLPEYFNDQNTKSVLDRVIDCTYVGKGIKHHGNPGPRPDTIFIGSNLTGMSISRPALAELLKQTRILYTYDPVSQVIQEAILCGAMVSILDWRPIDNIPLENTFSFPNVRVQDNNIIVPLNYQQDRARYIAYYKSLASDYLNNLSKVVHNIQNHFGIK